MTVIDLIQHKYALPALTGLGGIIVSWFTQRFLNKRGVFSYNVSHVRIGVTADDPIFGSVLVTWNGKQVRNLYLSTIEVKNESLNDYENVAICAYTSDTALMTEQTHILDTPNILEWTERYKKKLSVPPNETPSQVQQNIFNGQREYLVPVFNRGQSIRITYLNSAHNGMMPSIWVSVERKGVKLKFKAPQGKVFGVQLAAASVVGLIMGIVVLVLLGVFVTNVWLAALGALAYGLSAQLFGALVIRASRKVRDAIGG